MDQSTLERVCENGTMYSPATMHYNNSLASVICDNCRRTNIDVCCGLDKYDVCIQCYNAYKASKRALGNVSSGLNVKTMRPTVDVPKPESPKERPQSRMMVRQFEKRKSPDEE